MIPLGSRSIRSVIVGDDEIRETLSGWSGDAGATLDVETVDPDAVGNGEELADCIVVDGDALGADCVDVVEECPDDKPVVLLVDGAEGTVAEALSAGATETLPRRLADADPGVFAEQLVETVEREHARSGFDDLFESVSDGLVVHDPETGEIRDVNERYCALTGYDRDELVGTNIRRIVPDDPDYTYEDAIERIERARRHGPQLFEFKTRRKDGVTFMAEVNLSVVELHGEERVLASVRDVSERKRREREHRRAEERFDLVTRNVDEAIFIARGPHSRPTGGVDTPDAHPEAALARWEFEYLTPAVGHTLDRPVEDVYENPTLLMELIVPEDRPDYDEWLREVSAEMADGTLRDSYTVEYRVQDSDGEVRWMRTNAYPAPLDEEDVYRLVGITEDITDRRERQHRLEAERDRRSMLFENSPDPIMTVVFEDDHPHVTEVNTAFEEVFGFDADAVGDRPLGEVLIPDDERDRFEEFRTRAARGERIEAEARRTTADGQREFLFRVIPFEADGTRRAYVWYTDVTERKRRERELRHLNEEYETIFENVQDALFLIDVERTDDGTEFVYRRLTGPRSDPAGPRSEQLEGQTPREAFGPDQGAEMEANYRHVLETESTLAYEEEIERPGGTSVWRTRLSPVIVDGEVTQVVGSARDITERRHRERVIETLHDATERLQDADTTEAVCRTAVRAARDVLDFPMTACWLHRDTDDGSTLDPVAATDPVRDLDPAQFQPGDVEYETFRDGETLVYDPSEHFPENPLDAAIMLPLGEHGLLAVGKLGVAEYDEFVVDAARTLAGHVRTALDRVARAQQLRENERRLAAILDRIDEAIFLAPAREINDSDAAADYVSAGYEDVYGLSLEEMHETYDEGFFGILHPDDYEDYWTLVERIHRDLGTDDAPDRYSHEYRIELPDGERRWIHSDFYLTEWNDGESKIVVASRDVTDRKTRERTLESFHDATAELTTAETVAQAGTVAVQAAADVFELPATAVYHYDEEGGVLESVAQGPGVGSDLPALTAEDGPAWESFVEERIRRVAVEEVPALEAGPTDEVLFVPLGGNGLLVVWQTGTGLDPDAASIMAATVEAALNRLRGERRLESHSEELEAQVERTRRLEAITELTKRVEAAITAESTRQGVQDAVCGELIDVDPFEAAWVAEADVGTDRLTPRAVAGVDRDSVEQALASDDPGDPHPAREAWQTGDPAVVNDLVGGRRSDWRRTLLGRGAGSVCAVPLAYGGVTHGVLTIVAADPDAFREREREVLDQLGTSIGYAITAIQRQRALESDDTLELEFRGDEADLPVARLARALECRARHERTVRRQDGSVSVYYTLAGDLPPDVTAAAADTLPGDVQTVTRDDGEAVIERQGSSWFGAVVSEYGGVVRRGHATPTDVTLVVELPQKADTRTIVERVTESFPGLDLTAQRHHRETAVTPREVAARLEGRLTDRQYEALETAHAMGYFDWPRQSTGEDVADALDITQPTVNKHIRLGEREVFEVLFGSSFSDG